MLVRIVAILSLSAVSLSAQEAELSELLAQAEAYDRNRPRTPGIEKDSDRARDLYQTILNSYPDAPEAYEVMFRLGGLQLDGDYDQKLKGLATVEAALKKFDYSDYYRARRQPEETPREYALITMAIYAGETRQFFLGEVEAPRAHYWNGMEMLYETYTRRRTDWLNQPEPVRSGPEYDHPMGQAKLQSVREYLRTQREAARKGEVFAPDSDEMSFVRSLVTHYRNTYRDPDDADDALSLIAESFPDSPFETEALRLKAGR